VAVKRGPLVYCLESEDISQQADINQITLDIHSNFETHKQTIANRTVLAIKAKAFVQPNDWNKILYRPIAKEKEMVQINLVPYFSWGNRLKGDMTVWMPY
jgi:DUF1680 family protein